MSESGIMAAGNTTNPCLILLRSKGYDLWLEKLSDHEILWCASKDEKHFAGHSAPELLGLVTLWEHYGQGWNRQMPDVLEDLFEQMESGSPNALG